MGSIWSLTAPTVPAQMGLSELFVSTGFWLAIVLLVGTVVLGVTFLLMREWPQSSSSAPPSEN
ncbi:hypothetical protein [Candidatus Halobonum tyrrellensis]|uniref:hypothetical protein n=1 Tax=Candidatus Halobonum tyrrellensis TaxID=1431545 RepID=UPI00067802E2|nr:hypothetical protein [Candidatus Halobonum tyrrellensis]